jgi:preprotein translocase subunit SecG
MILNYLVTTLYVLVCFVMILIVLMQYGRAGDIASAFGGSSSQTAFGARTGATVLSKMTTICAVLFMVGALTLSILGQRGPGSVVGGVPAPAATATPAPATAPTSPVAAPSPTGSAIPDVTPVEGAPASPAASPTAAPSTPAASPTSAPATPAPVVSPTPTATPR